MICDLSQSDSIPVFEADVCIVGAGAAGLTLAAELVSQGQRVLLLESGGRELEEKIQQLNQIEKSGQPQKAPHLGRFRQLGGTAKRWGGQILEMYDEDFSPRGWIPSSGWPIAKQVLHAFYARALRAGGLSRVLATDVEVWQQLHRPVPQLDDNLVSYCTRWCPEPDLSRVYREMLQSPNLCIVLHATACAMPLNPDRASIAGVLCRDLVGNQKTFCAKKYVLCLGMLETIQLLLQPMPSGQLPWQSNGWLGKHVQSHIDYNAARLIPTCSANRVKLQQYFSNIYLQSRKYHPKLRLSAEAQSDKQILSIAGAVTCISPVELEVRQLKSTARNLLRGNFSAIRLSHLIRVVRQIPLLARLGIGYLIHNRAHWYADGTLWLRVHCEQEPLSASSITLSSERDALGMFRSHLDWHVSPLEWKTIQSFAATVKTAFEAAGLATVALQPELLREDGFRDVIFDDSYHWMGGTRMSVSADDGVVDPNLKIHGIDNAYVCSTSVFPTSGFSNPTHTLLALAIRLADHLAETKPNV